MSEQVGGDHYKHSTTEDGIQHWDVIAEIFGPGYFIGCATAYIARWRFKNGLEDLRKAESFLVKALELWTDGWDVPTFIEELLPKWLGTLGHEERNICNALLLAPLDRSDIEFGLKLLRDLIDSSLEKDVASGAYEHAGRPPALWEEGITVSPKSTEGRQRNPKDIAGSVKPRWFSVLPLRVLIGVGKAMFEGGWKYGLHNYRHTPITASAYVDACVCGHLTPWQEGQNYDERGIHHIDKAIASLMVLRDCILSGQWIDDRPIKAEGFDEQMERESDHFGLLKSDLRQTHGDPKSPYTEKDVIDGVDRE